MAERTKDQQIKLVCFDLAKHSFTLYDVDAAGQPVRGNPPRRAGAIGVEKVKLWRGLLWVVTCR